YFTVTIKLSLMIILSVYRNKTASIKHQLELKTPVIIIHTIFRKYCFYSFAKEFCKRHDCFSTDLENFEEVLKQIDPRFHHWDPLD
ncbi:MAG: hypothetical protein LBH00_01965, partial [Planctomycetaceae bacterium]|nr:hypothetical protein [Planctomycetaceae bacterium]